MGFTLHAQNMPVRPLLEKMAKALHQNVLITSAVQGQVSMNLEGVPWQKALTTVLKMQGLVMEKQNAIAIIMPESEYAEQKESNLQFQKKLSELTPLRFESISLHYANAEKLAALLNRKDNGLLSKRGSVSFDNRTNVLLLEDTPKKLASIRQLVKRLDVPIKQVLIKARIVNLDRQYEHELGLRFGLSRPQHLSGTWGGGNTTLLNHLNVDMPTTNLFGASSHAGLAVAKLGAGVMVDMELSAMEKQHLLKIVASPRLIASHAEQALIESGTEIPYEQRSQGDATSATFKKAVLKLSVKPQITEQHKILLTVEVNQDKPGEITKNGLTIKTEHVKTQLILNNKQTVIVGGIYETTQQNATERVPFFGALPLVGSLFVHKVKINDMHELLIFITPEILQ